MAGQESPTTRVSGLTKRTLLILTMLILLLVPSNIYIALAGGVFGVLSNYTLVLLFIYVSRFLGADLSKQEVYALFYALSFQVFFSAYPLIYRAYLRVGEVTNSFLIAGQPVAKLLPTWLAPPADSPIFALRTFFHPHMLVPLLIALTFTVLWLIAELSMILLTSYLFVEVESLPFPFAQIDATYISMLTDRPAEWLRGFLPMVGILFFVSTLIYLPSVGIIVGLPVPAIGFYDFTPQITDYLPGGIIGVDFTPWAFFSGFMMPLDVTAAALVTSILVWTILNSLFVTHPFFRSFFPDWAQEYQKGMTFWMIWERSTLRIWAPIQMGAALGMSILLVVRYRKEIARALTALARAGSAQAREYPPLPVLLAMFFVATGAASVLYWMLMPGLPLYVIAAMVMGLGLLIPITNAYMTGKAGPSLGMPPYAWQAVVYSMIDVLPPSTRVAALLFGPPMVGGMTGGGVQAIKVASLVGARPMDLVKIIVISFVIGTIVNILVLDAMWKLAPIPSMAYPSTVGMRDQSAYDCVVMSGVLPLKPEVILPSTGFFLLLFAALESMNIVFHWPLSIAGVMMGLTTNPGTAIMRFISSLLASYIVPKLIGRERAARWSGFKGVVASGALLGDGLASSIFTLIGLIGRASWTWPW
ncbi:MAG: hypothetical protein QW518_06165 [Thermofilaceae archaeon]